MIELGMTTIDDIVYQYKDTNIDSSDKGDFDIAFRSESNEGVRVFIYNSLGKEVYKNTFESMANFKQNIQLKNQVAPGVYFLAVYEGDRKMVKKDVFE